MRVDNIGLLPYINKNFSKTTNHLRTTAYDTFEKSNATSSINTISFSNNPIINNEKSPYDVFINDYCANFA